MFQRMMAIPQEEYIQLTSVQSAKQPLVQQMKNLTTQYEEESHIRDPYRKLMRQGETLDAMKGLKDKMRQQIVTATPKPYQSRTRSLLHHLEPFLKVNDRGEIFNDRDELIEHSRIDDLLQYAVRDRRRSNFVPTGWYSFLRTIRENNIPRYMLSRDTLDALRELNFKVKTPEKTVLKRERSSDLGKSPQRKKKLIPKREPKTSPPKRSRRKHAPSPTRQRPKRRLKEPEKFGFVQQFR